MDLLSNVDWGKVLLPDTSLLEIFVRGTLMYLALFVLLRLVLKREAGTVGITDLLVVVLIADAAQNGLADDYQSVSDGLLLVSTIIFWCYALDWLGYHVPALQRFVRPPPLPLVRNGRMLINNMRRELITREELLSMLRQQGVDDLDEVKVAFMEGDGRLSVITHNGKQQQQEPRRV